MLYFIFAISKFIASVEKYRLRSKISKFNHVSKYSKFKISFATNRLNTSQTWFLIGVGWTLFARYPRKKHYLIFSLSPLEANHLRRKIISIPIYWCQMFAPLYRTRPGSWPGLKLTGKRGTSVGWWVKCMSVDKADETRGRWRCLSSQTTSRHSVAIEKVAGIWPTPPAGLAAWLAMDPPFPLRVSRAKLLQNNCTTCKQKMQINGWKKESGSWNDNEINSRSTVPFKMMNLFSHINIWHLKSKTFYIFSTF